MYIGIRDDDTNYLTKPDRLESVYGGIWDDVPVLLACVPLINDETDFISQKLDSTHRIEEDEELIKFIQQQVASDRAEVAMHGYTHSRPRDLPEFVGAKNPRERIEHGMEILESAFQEPPEIFVPPHVNMSRKGTHAVTKKGFDVVRGKGPKPREAQFNIEWLYNFTKIGFFYTAYSDDVRYPSPVDMGTHREIYCHRVNNHISLETLKRGFDFAQDSNSSFVVSTHARTLNEQGQYRLKSILNYAQSKGAIGAPMSTILAN